MRLRRVLIIMISLLIMTSAWIPSPALAADADELVTLSNVRVSPASLPGDGQVTVTVNVAVDPARATGLTNAVISGPGVVDGSQSVTDIQIGENKDLTCKLNVTASQLGNSIPLAVKWDGEANGNSFSVTVGSSAPSEPQIDFYRTIDKTSVAKGDTITLIYSVENKGSIDITDLVITDEGIDGMKLTKNVLKAGSSTALTYSYKITADFTSKPKLTFNAGGKSYVATYSARTVTLKTEQLDVALSLADGTGEVKAGDEITLVCMLTNSGNVKFTDLSVSDAALGNNLYTSSSINNDASKEFSTKVTLTQTMKFQFTVSAKDEDGNPVTFQSNVLEVPVTSGGSQNDYEIIANSDVVQLAQPGEVNFSITVRNNGTAPVTGATVTDQNGGVVKTFDSLPVGVSQFNYKTTAEKTTEYNFCLTVPGTDGNYQVFSGPVEVKVADIATASPAATVTGPSVQPSPTATNGSRSSSVRSMMVALIVVGTLIVATIVILVVMVAADRKARRNRPR